MHVSSVLAALTALSCCASSTISRPRDYDTHDYYAVHLHPSTSPAEVATYFGLELEGQLGQLEDHYLYRKPRHPNNVIGEVMKEHKKMVRKRDGIYRNPLLDGLLLHQKQKLKAPMEKRGPLYPHLNPRSELRQAVGGEEGTDKDDATVEYGKQIAQSLGIMDPSFHEQWHLYNPVQLGHDLNVTGVWTQGITGKNSTVVIVDDGLDMDSEDLKDNYYPEGSYDFNERVPEPRPRLSDDRHGTRCAGEVSAVKNDVCGVGVAWDSKIAGIRILSKPITDADEAIAMNYGFNKTQIYSCSWGPPDDGRQMGEPGILIKRAMVNAVQKGRGGLGTIYVFAAGNGAAVDDNCNFDGYTNSIYSITVGAIDRKGTHPYYSEKCSAQLVVTYSSGSGDAIHTTDVGLNNCYAGHGGTSAAGPLAVGLYALVLEVRPDLTWRDIQWLTVMTAVPLEQESDWQNTTVGKRYSHQFGYGKLDAWALVEAAKTFHSVKPQAWYSSPWQHVRHFIPEGQKGLASTFMVTEEALQQANFETVEHVTVTMNVEHTRRGDLSVDLTSPSGIVSHLSTSRMNDNIGEGYIDWTFMSVAHWGESGLGEWTILVKDTIENEHNGTFVDWKLNLFGESKIADIQGLLPLPTEHDDDDHDREDAAVSITSVALPTSTGPPIEVPTDHIDRPVNDKPTAKLPTVTNLPEGIPTSVFEQPADYEDADDEYDDWQDDEQGDDVKPFPSDVTTTPTETGIPSSGSSAPAPSASSWLENSFLPSFLPTFGVSPRTQIWMYGSAVLILLFCASIAFYLLDARRRRQRTLARDNYEFEVLESNDDEDGKNGDGKIGGRKSKRRAGELYDAFAGESDEEMFSSDEDERYRDERARFAEKSTITGTGDAH